MTLTVAAQSTCAYSKAGNQEKRAGLIQAHWILFQEASSSLTLDETVSLKHFQNVDLCSAFYSQVHFSLSCIGEGNGNPLQCSCLENPRDGGA